MFNQTLRISGAPDCGNPFTRVIKAHKRTEYGVSTNGGGSIIKGSYHVFDVEVFNEMGSSIGRITYTPEWGRCLVTSDATCSQSGTLQIENVILNFSLQK